MKIGIFTCGYQRNPIEHIFEDAVRFGYDYVELWGGRPHAYAYDLRAGDIYEIKRLIEKYEMPVEVFCPEHNAYPYNYMIGSEAQRQDAVKYLKVCMDMAKEMGASYTLISAGHAGYNTPQTEIWKRFIYTVRELTDYAERIGHKLIIEPLTPYETNVCVSIADVERLFEAVHSPNLVTMLDTVAAFSCGDNMMAYFDKLGDKVDHIHLIDGVLGSDSHMVPGTGDIPLESFIYELQEINYQKTATIELVTNYLNEPRLYAKKAIDNVRTMMETARLTRKK